MKYQTPVGSFWATKWTEFYTNAPYGDTILPFPTHGFTATWNDGKQITQDELALKSDLPTKTSDLTNDSGFVTSAEVQPYYVFESGTTNNTGVAMRAAVLASAINRPVLFEKYGTVSPYITFDPSELTPKFSLKANYVVFFPWKLSKFFETTYSPELELVWWCGDFYRVRGGRFATTYTGFMWRTKGLGFAIPCSQDGIPDGRLFEITQIDEVNHKVGNNGGTENHTITGNENWSAILTIDEQENQIICTRSITQRAKENKQTFPTMDDIPTKTSDLTNDSGFITSADIITKRDLNDFNVYVNPMADMTTTKFNVVVSYAFDPSSPLFTVELTHRGGEETSWSWSPSGSNQSMMIDYYSVTDTYTLHYFNIQDGGGNEHSGSMTTPLTSPYWTGEVQDDWFHFSVTSQTTTITTKAYVDSLIAQLSARITALENNNQ